MAMVNLKRQRKSAHLDSFWLLFEVRMKVSIALCQTTMLVEHFKTENRDSDEGIK